MLHVDFPKYSNIGQVNHSEEEQITSD